MRNRYQGRAKKSRGNFEVVAGRGLAVRVPLPLVEVWEELQAEIERLTGTPTGTYAITVTGTSGSVQNSTTVTLPVQ